MQHLETIILVIGLIASFVTVSSSIPLTLRLLIKKQTTGLAPLFSLLNIVSGIFWITYGGLLFKQIDISPIVNSSTAAITASLPIIITNVVGVGCHITNLIVKYQMVSGAKKNNMTEKQFCDVFHEKQMQKKLAKAKK